MAHPSQPFANGSNAAIVIDENTTLGTYRVQLFTTHGDITALQPAQVWNFTDADAKAGKLLMLLKQLLVGLI